MVGDELDTATVRAGMVTYRVILGWQPTTRDVAEFCNMSVNGAWDLMARLCRVLPIYLDESDHKWRKMAGVGVAPLVIRENCQQED